MNIGAGGGQFHTVGPGVFSADGQVWSHWELGSAVGIGSNAGPGGIAGIVVGDASLSRVGAGQLQANGGVGMFGVAPPAAKPATPVTLADVIARLQAYGMVA